MFESRKERVVLPTAPRSARGNEVDEDRVPQHPPFLAYMSNLPYDLEEEDLMIFFDKLKVCILS
jgi:translation initiation factor 4B